MCSVHGESVICVFVCIREKKRAKNVFCSWRESGLCVCVFVLERERKMCSVHGESVIYVFVCLC